MTPIQQGSSLYKAILGALIGILAFALTGLWAFSSAIASDTNQAQQRLAQHTEAIHRIDSRHTDDMCLLREELKQMRSELVRIRQEQAEGNKTMAGVLAVLKARQP